MPGFVDSHTHLIFPPAGSADAESAERVAHAASSKRLHSRVQGYVEAMARHGTTTLEAKTSGTLDDNLETKLLRVLTALKNGPLDLVPTLNCRLPRSHPAEALERMIQGLLPTVRRRRLARFAELVWEDAAASEHYLRFLSAAQELGYSCRIHAAHPAVEFALAAAVERNVAAIDHVEYATPGAIHALAASNTMVTLLPCATFGSGGMTAPGRALIDAGAAIALATNFNPQHTPALNMQAVVSLACIRMGLTPAEAIAATTINGAHALGCANRVGSLEPGKSADLLMLNISDYREMPDHFGMNLVHMTLKRGACIYKEARVAPRAAEALRATWG
jgi:imidazolonepropionase